MSKIDEIRETLDKLYGHLAIVEQERQSLITQGVKIGRESGYKSGFEAGFTEGFKEGKVFPDAPVADLLKNWQKGN